MIETVLVLVGTVFISMSAGYVLGYWCGWCDHRDRAMKILREFYPSVLGWPQIREAMRTKQPKSMSEPPKP